MVDSYVLTSPITGVIQWCILAPMVDTSQFYSGTTSTSSILNSTSNGSNLTASNSTGSNSTGSNLTGSNSIECDFKHLVAQLHAEVLSVLLSQSQTPSHPSRATTCLNSDDVAKIVATLLTFNQKQQVGGAGTGREGGAGREEGGEKMRRKVQGQKMEECVERFAQFLQISLSAKVLQLKAGTKNFPLENYMQYRDT